MLSEPTAYVSNSTGVPIKLSASEKELKAESPDPQCRQTIPYSQILWVEFKDDCFTVDYVSDPTKSAVKVHRQEWASFERESVSTYGEFVEELRNRAYGRAKLGKRVYVLINPHSGPGGALKKWQTQVKPMFEAARLEVEEVTLTRGGEATDLVEEMDLDSFDAVVPCSGDGTAYEVFNGLAKRPDARRALGTMAVGHIPCGSGNALSLNLYGSNKIAVAALGVIKGISMPVDLVSVTQGSDRTLSFLSQSLGIIAESDLGTEHLRWMGSKRFEVGILSRIYQKRCYPCDLWVKVEVQDKEGVIEHYAKHRKEIEAAENPPSVTAPAALDQASEPQGLPPLRYGTVNDDLSTLEGWEQIPGDKLGIFYCGNMAWMSPDANFFPGTLPSDGYMDLVLMNGDSSALKATMAFLSVESGKFFHLPEVSYRKITAYRLIPKDQDSGYISVDGESVPFEALQAEIHQGLGRCLSPNGKLFEAPGPLGWEDSCSKQVEDGQETAQASGNVNGDDDGNGNHDVARDEKDAVHGVNGDGGNAAGGDHATSDSDHKGPEDSNKDSPESNNGAKN